jgi:hypothetical protein
MPIAMKVVVWKSLCRGGSGSTHSFLDPRIIKGQDYSITPTKPMLIEVAKGGKMDGQQFSMQGGKKVITRL